MEGLFTLEQTSLGSILAELFILVAISVLLGYGVMVYRVKNGYDSRVSYQQRTKLAFLDALIFLMLGFVLYMTAFTAAVGSKAFNWSDFPFTIANTYFQLLPQMVVLGFLIVLYFRTSSNIKAEINN